jgi:hypothetical protein
VYNKNTFFVRKRTWNTQKRFARGTHHKERCLMWILLIYN